VKLFENLEALRGIPAVPTLTPHPFVKLLITGGGLGAMTQAMRSCTRQFGQAMYRLQIVGSPDILSCRVTRQLKEGFVPKWLRKFTISYDH
jgi:hypothetical protein